MWLGGHALLGVLGGALTLSPAGSSYDPVEWLTLLVACGAVVQWVLLRIVLARWLWWWPPTVLAVPVGAALGLVTAVGSAALGPWGQLGIPGELLLSVSAAAGGAVGGLFVGGIQWLALRRHAPHAVAWVPGSAAGAAFLGPVAVYLIAPDTPLSDTPTAAAACAACGLAYAACTLGALLRSPGKANAPPTITP